MVARGDVWWGPAPFKDSPAYRPWLLVSTDIHPFASEESIALALTSRDHADGVPVPREAWVEGTSDVDSFVSPWYVTTLKTRTLDRRQGHLEAGFVGSVVAKLHQYVPADGRT